VEKIVIATRESQLALWQAYYIQDEIRKKFPNIVVEINKMTSKGDKILDKPLALIGGKGHFTKELEDAMLEGKANLAVHSLKDVPTFIPDGLELAAITKRQDQSDLFLSHKYKSFEELPKGAVVGTTSLRRRMQLLAKRPDLVVKDLRGNVNTRLRKLKEGQYDAIILAYIGLKRLDLIKDIPYTQKLDFMIPPMGQAALGIEIVANDNLAKEVAKALNDEETFKVTKVERDFIAKIGAGCSAPVAVNAKIEGDKIKVVALIGLVDGSKIMKEELEDSVENYENLGEKLASIMIEKGAIALLKEAEENAFKEYRPNRL
jgi:hydroxymethylbilane synthase